RFLATLVPIMEALGVAVPPMLQATRLGAFVEHHPNLTQTVKNELKDFEPAVRTLEKAHAMKPGNLELAEQLLDAYIQSGDFGKAEPLLAGIIEQLESSQEINKLPRFHHLRGQLAMRAGNEEQVLVSFQAAYDIDATYLPNLLDLGKYKYRRD